jgi:hypothetical protein
MSTVTITENPLAFEDLLSIVNGAPVELTDSARATIAASRAVVDRALAIAKVRMVEEAIMVADPQPDAVHRALRERFPVRTVGESATTGRNAAR